MKNFNLIESGFVNVLIGLIAAVLVFAARTDWFNVNFEATTWHGIGTFVLMVAAGVAGVLLGEVIERIIPEKKRK